ncbi:MAG: hypothetical protein WAN36_07155 [Calditrichia bacterium]
MNTNKWQTWREANPVPAGKSQNNYRTGLILIIIFSFLKVMPAQQLSEPEIAGTFGGIFNSIRQIDIPDDQPARTQFDFAGNLDFNWEVSSRLSANIQFQMGPGEGTVGMVDGLEMADLFLQYSAAKNVNLLLGSFDTPFGASVPYLSNNADLSQNPLILNDLFYSVFSGSAVGTLNTLGLGGELNSHWGSINAAVSNGTAETALNADGAFEITVSGLSAPVGNLLQAGASFIYSPDSSRRGASGFGVDFSGWMVDGFLGKVPERYFHIYYGHLVYDDHNSATKDGVRIWSAESRIKAGDLYLSGRVSGWEPGDHDGSAEGFSSALMNPGFGEFPHELNVADQRVLRFQIGSGWNFSEKMLGKLEFFYDNYQYTINSRNYDAFGGILALVVQLGE